MSVVKFPTKLPTMDQLTLPQAQLFGLAQEAASDIMKIANRLWQHPALAGNGAGKGKIEPKNIAKSREK